MKKILLLIVTVMVLFSCKKETLSLLKQPEIAAPANGHGNKHFKIKQGAAPLLDSSHVFGATAEIVDNGDSVLLTFTQINPLPVPGTVFKWVNFKTTTPIGFGLLFVSGWYEPNQISFFSTPFSFKVHPNDGAGQYTFWMGDTYGVYGDNLSQFLFDSNQVIIQSN